MLQMLGEMTVGATFAEELMKMARNEHTGKDILIGKMAICCLQQLRKC